MRSGAIWSARMRTFPVSAARHVQDEVRGKSQGFKTCVASKEQSIATNEHRMRAKRKVRRHLTAQVNRLTNCRTGRVGTADRRLMTRLRVAFVAPSLAILGGQAVQADRLLHAWRDDRRGRRVPGSGQPRAAGAAAVRLPGEIPANHRESAHLWAEPVAPAGRRGCRSRLFSLVLVVPAGSPSGHARRAGAGPSGRAELPQRTGARSSPAFVHRAGRDCLRRPQRRAVDVPGGRVQGIRHRRDHHPEHRRSGALPVSRADPAAAAAGVDEKLRVPVQRRDDAARVPDRPEPVARRIADAGGRRPGRSRPARAGGSARTAARDVCRPRPARSRSPTPTPRTTSTFRARTSTTCRRRCSRPSRAACRSSRRAPAAFRRS